MSGIGFNWWSQKDHKTYKGSIGLSGVLWIFFAFELLGAIVTFFCVPEVFWPIPYYKQSLTVFRPEATMPMPLISKNMPLSMALIMPPPEQPQSLPPPSRLNKYLKNLMLKEKGRQFRPFERYHKFI